MDLSDCTAIIPIKRGGGNREWLAQAIGSLYGMPYLVMENDGEVSEARNEGMRQAGTEYVLFLDADDVAAPPSKKSGSMVEELRRAVWDVDVAYPEMVLVTEDLTGVYSHHQAQPFCRYRLAQGNYIPCSSMVRRTKALEVGGFRDFPILEDWDLWLRMSNAGARFKAVPSARLFYRQVENSRNKNQDVDWEEIAKQIVGEDPTKDALATFYYSPTAAVAYLRCVMPARHLPGVAREGLDLAIGPDGEHKFIGHRGAAVFQLAAGKTEAVVAAQMKADGVRVLVETDDNYFAAGGASRFREKAQWSKHIGDKPHSVDGHRWIVENADGVIVTTDWLARQYRKVNPNVYVCPNQVDPDDWQPLKKPTDGVFRIGWFASDSHAGDGKLIQRAMEWASKQEGVEVVTLGHDPRWAFKYRRLPWTTDLSMYRQAMQMLDVGVCPVIGTSFALGRSDLKWLEYSMSGAASIVSDNAPYSSVPDELALRASTPAEWLKQVQHLVQNRDEAKAMGLAGREYVLEHRTIKANLHKWKEALAA